MNIIRYTDRTGNEYSETVTGPIDLITRADELEQQGYTVNSD